MDDKTKGVLFMLFSSLSFAAMGATVKLADEFTVFQKMFARNLVSFIIAYYFVKRASLPLFGAKKNIKWLLLRSFLGLAGVGLYFYSIDHLYLADSSMLNKIHPFFVALFAFLILKERLSKAQIPAMIIIFSAALLIIKPKFDLSIIPALAGFASAMFAGAAYVFVRLLGGKGEQPATIVFFFSLVSVIVTFPLALIDLQTAAPTQYIYLIATGVFAAGGQFGLTYAYKLSKAGEVAVYNYTHIIFSAVIGYLIWNEIPDAYSLIGGIIIIIVSLILYLFNKKHP